jgi:undecaprenyl-diphosphatase
MEIFTYIAAINYNICGRHSMSIGNAIFQGIIQGLTEFLPVSSSGHLSLIQYFTGEGSEAGLFFTVMLHVGTLLAVFLAFWKTISALITEFFRMLGDIFARRFSWREASPHRRMVILLIFSLLPMIITVFLRDWFESFSTDSDIFAEGICFLITSALLFISDRSVKGHKTAKNMSPADAVAVGVVQAFAPLPGISRSGSTIAAGLLAGLDRKYAVSFSFIMGVPAVLGATALEIGDAIKQESAIPFAAMALGALAALVFGLLAIRMVRWLVVSDKFKIFAWYTLILGLLTVIAAIIEKLSGGLLQQILANI